ncbi:acyl carrier protein phosphodiesterase [Eudoraea chungangensis]|uniref:acyl carrier protein phosphodiesterase n=1 Tax=Eudoraea chungangensis TaxID=1481905 RepID=UPI0023EAFE2C|nr:acyl carrier protein phosphodiesterase [Eudoraea chungangensis]
MNFLAHIYLSFDDDEISIGNFIADSIKGNKYHHLPPKVQKGILLHRDIDTFTDAHPTPRKSSKRLHEKYGHYSRVIVDIFYDHFLAKNWEIYSKTSLSRFADNFYGVLESNSEILPENTLKMMPYLIHDNWLLSYASLDGISRVLDGMNRRTKNRSKMNLSINELQEFYSDFEAEFTSFFEELIIFSKQKFISLCE